VSFGSFDQAKEQLRKEMMGSIGRGGVRRGAGGDSSPPSGGSE
jgi:hypothetical protein